MAGTAAHLIDRVLAQVPVRQWVLSLPFALRYRLAYDAALTSAVLDLFVRAVFASLRRRARRQRGVARGQCGTLTFVQRFGDALTLNVHFHSLVLDGVYAPGPGGGPRRHLPTRRSTRPVDRRRPRLRAGGCAGALARRAAETPATTGPGAFLGRRSPGVDGLALPRETGLLLVHAVNPFGFAAVRRVNESNVDLNRNFLRHPDEHEPNPDYDALYGHINPDSLDPESEAASRAALLAFAQREGFPRLQAALTRGQYAHPRGMQYGGAREGASNRALRAVARRETRGARRIAWIDVHTGLGPYGEVASGSIGWR